MTTPEQINAFWAASGLSNPTPPHVEPEPLTPAQQHFFGLAPRPAPHQHAGENTPVTPPCAAPTSRHDTATVQMSDELDAREAEAKQYELAQKFFGQLG